MQIMTFPLGRGTDLGIRMTEIRKIEALGGAMAENPEHTSCHPQTWFGLPVPENLSRSKGIFLSSFRRVMIVVPRIGRILRIGETPDPGRPHPEQNFLARYKTVEGPEVWVIDVPGMARQFDVHLQEDTADSLLPASDGNASQPDFFHQVGETARDIERVLSLSSSLVDSLKFMEGKIPETSHGLETVTRMTEDAAHKLMGTLESLLEEHNRIRTALSSLAGADPAKTGDTVALIGEMLSRGDERIMAGFEAMAFQDLVGQNIRLIGNHLKELESRLVQILIETAPESGEKKETRPLSREEDTTALKGIGAPGDVDQDSVDKLLSEFGF